MRNKATFVNMSPIYPSIYIWPLRLGGEISRQINSLVGYLIYFHAILASLTCLIALLCKINTSYRIILPNYPSEIASKNSFGTTHPKELLLHNRLPVQ